MELGSNPSDTSETGRIRTDVLRRSKTEPNSRDGTDGVLIDRKFEIVPNGKEDECFKFSLFIL